MQITTLDHIPGQAWEEMGAPLFSEQVQAVNAAKDLVGGIKAMFGGAVRAYSQEYQRARAAALGIPEMAQKENALRLSLPHPDFAQVAAVCGLEKYKSRLLFNAGDKPYLALRLRKGDDVLKLAGILLTDLEQAAGGERPSPV